MRDNIEMRDFFSGAAVLEQPPQKNKPYRLNHGGDAIEKWTDLEQAIVQSGIRKIKVQTKEQLAEVMRIMRAQKIRLRVSTDSQEIKDLLLNSNGHDAHVERLHDTNKRKILTPLSSPTSANHSPAWQPAVGYRTPEDIAENLRHTLVETRDMLRAGRQAAPIHISTLEGVEQNLPMLVALMHEFRPAAGQTTGRLIIKADKAIAPPFNAMVQRAYVQFKAQRAAKQVPQPPPTPLRTVPPETPAPAPQSLGSKIKNMFRWGRSPTA